MKLKLKLIIFCGLLIVAGCKKDKNVEPYITFSNPVVNSYFSTIDTIPIKCTIQDDKLIKAVSVSIIDNNNMLVSEAVLYPINKRTTVIDIKYIINKIHLLSGVYYIVINATDEESYTKAFLKINLIEIPKELNKIYLFSKYSNNSTKVYTIDSTNTIIYQFYFDDILNSAVTNSYFQSLSLLGKTHGNLITYNIADNTMLWQVNNLNNVLYEYKGTAKLIENFVYAGSALGDIRGYNNNGLVMNTSNINDNNYSPTQFIKFKNYIIAAIEPHNNQSKKIAIINYPSGVLYSNHNIDFDIINMFGLDDTKVIIWANKNNKIHIYTLDIVYNILDEITNLPDAKLSSAIKVDNTYYIAAIGDALYKYNSITKSIYTYKANTPANILKYDDLNSNVYAINGINITVFHYPEDQQINYIQHTDTIVNISFLYNK